MNMATPMISLVNFPPENVSSDKVLEKGKRYFCNLEDDSSVEIKPFTKYVMMYSSNSMSKETYVGYFNIDLFEKYENLLLNESLMNFINTDCSFTLKDIKDWCKNPLNRSSILAEMILRYITDHYSYAKQCALKSKRFKVRYKLFRKTEYSTEEYEKYMGYFLECVD